MRVSEYEADLRRCVGRCAAGERAVIAWTAELTKKLADLDAEIRRDGCDEELAGLHRELLTSVGSSLHRLGPGRIYPAAAVGVLARGYATAQAIFHILPVAGCA